MPIKKVCIIAAALLPLAPSTVTAALTRTVVKPTRIVWMSDTTGAYISKPEVLMSDFKDQADWLLPRALCLHLTARWP